MNQELGSRVSIWRLEQVALLAAGAGLGGWLGRICLLHDPTQDNHSHLSLPYSTSCPGNLTEIFSLSLKRAGVSWRQDLSRANWILNCSGNQTGQKTWSAQLCSACWALIGWMCVHSNEAKTTTNQEWAVQPRWRRKRPKPAERFPTRSGVHVSPCLCSRDTKTRPFHW